MNRTELYQLCKKAGMKVNPMNSKRNLAMFLSGELAPPAMVEENHPVDMWRWAIIDLISEYWMSLKAQVKCPAKYLKHPDPEKVNPKPCFGCPDQQVMHCVADNFVQEDRLRAHIARRKKNAGIE